MAALPAPSVIVRRVEIDGSGGEGRGVLSGADGVAEGQRIGAGASAIGSGAAVVKRQRRRAAGSVDGHDLAHAERNCDRFAGVEVAARRRLGQRRYGRRDGIDLRSALGQAGEREIGGVAGNVLHRSGVEIDGGSGEGRGVLSGADSVAECQRIGAGTAAIGGGAAVVERQRRGAACDRHRFVEIEAEGDGLAGIEVAVRRRLGQRRDGRRDGIDLRSALGQAGEREIGGVAGAVSDRRRIEIDGGGGKRRGVLPGAYGVAEGECIGAGTAAIGGGAAVVERQRRGAACDRHRFVEIESQSDRLAGVEVAARRRFGQRRYGRRDGIDLRTALGQAGEREIGSVAGNVLHRSGVEIDGGSGEGRGVLPGADSAAECQRIGAGTAAIGGGTAVVERQRGGAACDRHRFVEIEGEGDGLAGIEVAVRR